MVKIGSSSDSGDCPDSSRADLTRRIKDRAVALGFDLVGVTSADPLELDRQRLETWLARGRQSTMTYLGRDPTQRADVRLVVPQVRSVIVLGTLYAQQGPDDAGTTGKVARYARGKDYHRLTHKRLGRLQRAIAEESGYPFTGRSFVDSGPLLERALGNRAGLGFVGKNSMLIHPRMGSYFLMAECLTNLDLVVDAPVAWDCGSCRLCIDACPTGALDEPYTLSASQCLAYLTVEHRRPLPDAALGWVGTWAFGCDICQEVCPYNRTAPPSREAGFDPDRGLGATLPIDEILGLGDTAALVARFGGTPLVRTGRGAAVRNALLAAVAGVRRDLLDRIRALVDDHDPQVAQAARWAQTQLEALPP